MKEWIFFFIGTTETFAQNMLHFLFGEIDFSVFSTFQIITDISIVTLLLYALLRLIARAHATHIIATTIAFSALLFMSENFNLYASKIILQGILLLILVSLPLMFQYELKKFFEKLSSSPFSFLKKYSATRKHKLIKSVKHAAEILAEKQHGAIIVIEQTTPLDVYADTGIPLNAHVSKELLLNIFFPKSPLHDGAVIIRGTTVVCAGAVLPLSQNNTMFLGTRHKSALGLSEASDALIIVISEERGEISIAYDSELRKKVSLEYLEHFLEEHIHS